MTKLETIQSSIVELTPAEIARLRDWLDELDANRFDERLERDAANPESPLSRMAAEALSNLRTGKSENL